MDGWDCRVPIGTVIDEMIPELGGREPWGHNHRTPREQRSKKPSKKTMYMKKWHDQKRSIFWRQLVCPLYIFCPD